MNDQIDTSERHPLTASQRVSARRKKLRARLVLLLIIAVAIGGATSYWYVTRDYLSTDDAYTDGQAVTVAPQVAGTVVSLEITDNQFVHAGDPLIRIDPRSFEAARDQAAASLQVADAQLANARVNLASAQITYPARLEAAQAALIAARAVQFKAQADARRQRGLPRQATTQQDIDNAESALRSADAQVAQAEASVREADVVTQSIDQAKAQVRQLEAQVALGKAQLAQAELNLSWTRVLAPQDGWITKRAVEKGNYVSAGQAILSLVTPQVWVTANFKEDQLDRMHAGQTVDMTVDAFPGLRLTGHVDSVQLGSGQRFSAFPAENATGNFVKIVQRVPVKIIIDSGMDPQRPLPLGLSVVPTIHLAHE
jgi:membrane fusion protein (multidrug efflux system)